MFDFKEKPFQGNLMEIIEMAAEILPNSSIIIEAQNWVYQQIQNQDNTLPIRKWKLNPKKGKRFSFSGLPFLPVDNEPFTQVYDWLRQGQIPSRSYSELIYGKEVPVSVSVSDPEDRAKNLFKQGMVNTDFRQLGWKLAHLFDCAKGLPVPKSLDDLHERYLLAMSPINIFPFPSSGAVKFQSSINHSDIAESETVQRILLGFMNDYAGSEAFDLFLSKLSSVEYIPSPNWQAEARAIHVMVFPIKYLELTEKRLSPISQSSPKAGHKNGGIVKTRFFVDERIYQSLLSSDDEHLTIRVQGGTGKKVHPEGIYVIPRQAAVDFINEKRSKPNWHKNRNWHSIAVPVALRGYFKAS